MKHKDFIKKNVYIIGGSEGIGLEAAKLFAGMEANVFIFSRTKAKLENALKEIETCRKNPEQKFAFMELDVADNEKVKTVIEKACTEFGVADIFINNAGRAIPHYFEDITYEQFDQTLNINMYGIRNTVAAILPHMRKRGSGTIVNVSSMAGLAGIFGYTDYSASKFAIIGFSEALKSEVKWDNINVNVLCPPDTDTPGFKVENQTKPPETAEISSTAKIRTPEYVAKALIKGIKKDKFLIVPGFDGKMLLYVKRFFPGLVDIIIDGSIKKARKKKNK